MDFVNTSLGHADSPVSHSGPAGGNRTPSQELAHEASKCPWPPMPAPAGGGTRGDTGSSSPTPFPQSGTEVPSDPGQ